MAGELHPVHPLPDADDVGCSHPDEHGCERILQQADNGARAAAGVCLAIAGDALGRLDLDDDGVALGGAAHAHRDGLAFGQSKRERNRLDRRDLHLVSPRY